MVKIVFSVSFSNINSLVAQSTGRARKVSRPCPLPNASCLEVAYLAQAISPAASLHLLPPFPPLIAFALEDALI